MSSIQDSAMHIWVNGETITQDKLEQNRKVFETAINDNQSQISAQYTNAQIDAKVNTASSTTKVVQAGTVFPTTGLVDGQEFYRDDLKTLYIYDVTSSTWVDKVGNLTTLTTTAQSDVVSAINENMLKRRYLETDVFVNSFVYSGAVPTKDGTTANKLNVPAYNVYIKQSDNYLKRVVTSVTSYNTTTASTTFYLDLNPDGTFSWGTSHSTQPNYIPIVTVTSDASSNINVITDTRPILINLLSGSAGVVNLPGQSKSNGNPLVQALSGGYKLQSATTGAISLTASTTTGTTINFPAPFSTSDYRIETTIVAASSSPNGIFVEVSSKSAGSVALAIYSSTTQTAYFDWIAIGS